ncbi:MAG: hypothetical protein QGH30_09685, partial [Candidatus Krumholzibacteria bacterium]|nr:hypothetical protein [Candidatus Krumholzibacteria bacterium]
MLRKLVLGFLVFSLAVLFQGCESPTEPDTTPPTVTFVAGDVEGDGPFEFCATVTDEENAIASVLFSVGDDIFVGVAGDGGEYCATVEGDYLEDGLNTMLVTAEDAEGNSRTVAASFDYDSCPDETDPVISFAPGDLADAGPFTLTATVTDDSALASVTLTLNNETYAGNADGDVYSFTVSASGLFEGANSGIVTAVDACGNDASVTASFNYDACSDNEAPVIGFE